MLPFMISVPEGAATSCYLATNHDVDGIGGQYFANCKPAKVSPLANNVELRERLWAISSELVSFGAP